VSIKGTITCGCDIGVRQVLISRCHNSSQYLTKLLIMHSICTKTPLDDILKYRAIYERNLNDQEQMDGQRAAAIDSCQNEMKIWHREHSR
jgi:hypothetical protein